VRRIGIDEFSYRKRHRHIAPPLLWRHFT